MTQHIKTTKVGSLFTIQLNRPEALNALGFEMLTELKGTLLDAFADSDSKTIWLESSIKKAFCAGGDVKALAMEIDSVALDIEKSAIGQRYFELEYGIDLLIENSPKPIVAYAQGMTFGGGWGLYAGANLRLCSPKASFCMPENQIGFFPDVGAASFLQKNNWKLGTFVAISGLRLSALDAMALDYVDDIIPEDYAQTLKIQLADGLHISELDIESEPTMLDPIVNDWQDAIASLPETGTLGDWINVVEQNVSFKPFADAKHNWLTASSWSLAFTWEYFRAHRDSNRQHVLENDTRVGARLCSHPEFYEGVHAKLIEKTGTPKWLYSHVESVPIAEINRIIGPH
jgi:enoyl-CoA hydratase/carnithine racemase